MLKYLEGFETYFTDYGQGESYYRHAYPIIDHGKYTSNYPTSISGLYGGYALAFSGWTSLTHDIVPLYSYSQPNIPSITGYISGSGEYITLYNPMGFQRSLYTTGLYSSLDTDQSLTIGFRYKILTSGDASASFRIVIPDHYQSKQRGLFVEVAKFKNNDYHMHHWGIASNIDATGYLGKPMYGYGSKYMYNITGIWNYFEVTFCNIWHSAFGGGGYFNSMNAGRNYFNNVYCTGNDIPHIFIDDTPLVPMFDIDTSLPDPYLGTNVNEILDSTDLANYSGIYLMFKIGPNASGNSMIAVDDIYVYDGAEIDNFGISLPTQSRINNAHRSKIIPIYPVQDTTIKTWTAPVGGYHYSYVNTIPYTGLDSTINDLYASGTSTTRYELFRFSGVDLPYVGKIHSIVLNTTYKPYEPSDSLTDIYTSISGNYGSLMSQFGMLTTNNSIQPYTSGYTQFMSAISVRPSWFIPPEYSSYSFDHYWSKYWSFNYIKNTGLFIGLWVK